MTDDVARWIGGLAAIFLVVSSLISRRIPMRETVKMILAWLAIFSVVFVLFLFQDEARAVWQRATAELGGTRGQVSGNVLRVRKSEDGHFWVRASINGKPADFLIDSGATTTMLTPRTAANAGIEASSGFPVMVETANGIVEKRRAQIAILAVGPIQQRDAAVLIGADEMGTTNLLGMNFLSSLKQWRVEGATLILEPY